MEWGCLKMMTTSKAFQNLQRQRCQVRQIIDINTAAVTETSEQESHFQLKYITKTLILAFR